MKPLIKLFKLSNDECYFYDANRNEIVPITAAFYHYLESYLADECAALIPENQDHQKTFDDFVKRGYLSSHRVSVIKHPMTDYLESILDTKIESITLQITQNCNLRCNYCPYTGNYYINRKHSDQKMDIETAKKGVSFLAQHSTHSKEVSISFYGGEPLMEFEMVSSIIAYARQIFGQKKIIFALTTNGTIMTPAIMKMLVDNDVRLLFSLDGPEQVHDVNRRYVSGKGSFKDVIKNIMLLKNTYPEYFSNFVAINTVMDNNIDIMQIDQFYKNEALFEDIPIQTTITNPAYVKDDAEDLMVRRNEEDVIKYEFGKFLYLLHKIGRIDSNNSRVFKNYFDELVKTEKELIPSKTMPDVFHPSGPCIPGRKKLFMDIKGNFYPCERIDELSPVGVIGSVDTGIDISKVSALLNVGKITEEQCKNCWAISQCKTCFIHADDGEKLSAKKRLQRCVDVKENILEDFKDIVFLKKHYYDFGILESDK